MAAVMAAERTLDHTPEDVSKDNVGYDIASFVPTADGDSRTRMIEVKGRIEGSVTVTVTKNEILTAFNKPGDWILALVEVPKREETPEDVVASMLVENGPDYFTAEGCRLRYLRHPFQREPDFDAVSVNYSWSKLWNMDTLVE